MKKNQLLFYFLIIFLNNSNAQVLCIYCYEQNAPISPSITNLIVNGGFENGCGFNQYFCPNSNSYATNPCNLTNWTCTGGGTHTYATCWIAGISMAAEGAYAAYFGNSFCRACSLTPCDTTCLLTEGCVAQSPPVGFPLSGTEYGNDTGISLEQTVLGLVIGNTYILEFWAGGEAGAYTIDGLFAVDLGFGKLFLRNKPTPETSGIGRRFIIEFNATSTSHTIKFTNWGHICSFPRYTELVLDDVRLYTLSELNKTVPHCALTTDNPKIPNDNSIHLFPNPTRSSFTLSSPLSLVGSELSIYNSLGEIVRREIIHSAKQDIDLGLEAGVYYIELSEIPQGGIKVASAVQKLIVY